MAEQTAPRTEPAGLTGTPGPSRAEVLGLLLMSLLWLAATMWTTHRYLASKLVTGDPTQVPSAMALVLPVMVTATLLVGAAAALAVTGWSIVDAGRTPATMTATVLRRLLFGAAAGALCGAVGGAAILSWYGDGPYVGTLAATVVAAGLVGGLAAAMPRPVLGAAVTAAVGVFLLGVVLSVFQTPLKSVLGAGQTAGSQADAATWLAILSAVISGVVAGLAGYFALRLRRPDATPPRWPLVAAAGAFPGVLLLAAEAITEVGGSSLFAAVERLSPADRATLSYLAGSRLNQALVVGFIGAITAMIAIGRTMRPIAEDEES